MTLLGLELNATCARAVHGSVGEYPLTLPLDPPGKDLPMVLSLERNALQVGRAGQRHIRNQPHLTCSNFLAHLGERGKQARHWRAGRHQLDSSQALAAVWRHVALACAHSNGVVVALPPYLSRAQADLVCDLGARQKAPILGTLSAILAAALTGFAEQTWIGSVIVVDIDDHALSVGLLRAIDGEAHLLEARHLPQLGLRVWQDRLINALSDNCVLQSRRDPRDVPLAEQALYEQLDVLLDAGLNGRMIQIGIQAPQWYQNLLVRPEETTSFCAHLARQVASEVESFYYMVPPEEVPPPVLLTAQAGRLPGLAPLLRASIEEVVHEPARAIAMQELPAEEDFGAGLFQQSPGHTPGVTLLSADAVARAAHGIAAYFQRGDLPSGHLDTLAPLPLPQPVEAGPARLNFQGQDFYLTGPQFVLGSQSGCNLLLSSERFPLVAPRHCEIRFDQRVYLLHNRSRDGTLLNDALVSGSAKLHAGDWIRLGPDGPLVRFLGQLTGRNMTA